MAEAVSTTTIRRFPVQFVRTDDGVELCYQDIPAVKTAGAQNPKKEGGQPVLVFQHGYTSYRGTWFNVVAQLRHKYRCILIDMRGCGLSGRPTQPSAYSIPRFAEDVITVANAAGLDQFVYVGHSLGGGIGYHLALSAHKTRLQALCLVTPIPSRGIHDPQNSHQLEIQRREQFTLQQYKEYRETFFTRTAFIRAAEEEWTASLAMELNVPKVYYDSAWETMCSFRGDTSKITTPTIMITADADNLLGNNWRDYRAMKNASVHVFSRVSHNVPREVPHELASVIDEFVTHGVVNFGTLSARGTAFDAKHLNAKL